MFNGVSTGVIVNKVGVAPPEVIAWTVLLGLSVYGHGTISVKITLSKAERMEAGRSEGEARLGETILKDVLILRLKALLP